MAVNAYIHQLQLSIDHALAVSFRRNAYNGKAAFVAHITLVKGVPFYGYHVGYGFFLKIYMLTPVHMTRLADLLRQGAIMKKVIQPYESHMQYLLQWMCDYNLYGCSYIDCSEVKFRRPVPDYFNMNSTTHKWHDRTIPPSFISNEDEIPRQSHCSIEIDVCVHNILNRSGVKSRPIHHDFIEWQNPIAPDQKLVQSMESLWRDETRRRKARQGLTDSDSSPFPPEVLVSVSADPRHLQAGGWIHEEEYRDKINTIIKDEKSESDDQQIGFDKFVRKTPFEMNVRTALESVEDLYPSSLAASRTSQLASDGAKATTYEIPDVDESRVFSFEEDDFPYESDEELARELEMSQRKRGDKADDRMELFANEVSGRPTFDKDLQPPSSISAELMSRDVSPATDSIHNPRSSTKLKKSGIREAGDHEHIQEDAFEILPESASNITAETGMAWALESEHRKRRKIAHGGNARDVDTIVELPRTGEFNGHPQLDRRLRVTGEKLSLEETLWPQITMQHRKAQLKASDASSPICGMNGASVNAKLAFPIVKDPQDPATMMKLSQKSASPSRSSQKSKPKSVSFANATEPRFHESSQLKYSSQVSPVTPEKPSPNVQQCSSQIHQAFEIENTQPILLFSLDPPTVMDLQLGTLNANAPSVVYQDAFYSDSKDVPDRAREYAGKEFKIESDNLPYLPEFGKNDAALASLGLKPSVVVDKTVEDRFYRQARQTCGLRTWEIEKLPPTRLNVQEWLDRRGTADDTQFQPNVGDEALRPNGDLSQIDAATQKNRHGFKYSQKQKSTSVQHETQYMSVMSLEIHVNTRGNLVPNPEQDKVSCIFWCLQSDDEDLEVNGVNEGTHVGVLALSEEGGLGQQIAQQTSVEVEEESSELDMITRMVDIVRTYDPDILTGYEVHGGSWGYLIERARCEYDYNLCDEFSRMKSQSHGRFGKEDDRWGFNHTSTIRVTGRHMINIWRAMRGELNLLQYTMENVVFQLCHRRIPHYAFQDLTSWYCSGKPRDLAKVVDYYVSRSQLDLEILEQNELVPRTSEQARLLGVDFFSVFSRGSQFKVESLMFRIAKPENFLLPSPSRKQVGQQNSLECLPLVMEPQSAFYNSPLLVLDFQSLYPSVMIAYNYCYSTYLGRVVNWRGQNKMGFTDYHRPRRLLELFEDQINIAPNGIIYAKTEIRKSLLAKMLGEILETRVMVKSGMKVDKDDKTLQRLLNNRQLALKLIANVTYGYTSASFSGRMPSSEIADSIVQTGRETLEKAIALIHSVEKWGAEVVYGDTDSLFVYLKGRTKDEAFDIGKEIAEAITDMNPRPVKLKFEKVYFPCVLLAKKRYVGFKYESKSQKEPEFDAKGIETIRRDGTPAEQKIEEKALKILFRTADLSQVKAYFQKQCTKIMLGRVSIQDFCFAKEVKLGTYSDKGLPPPGALISTRRMLEDPRAEPQYGERVPYVVITGAPGARLIDRCVAPDILLHNDNNELDAEYYISKNLIPPLERIFNLVGANVRQWYDEMPKFQRIRRVEADSLSVGKDRLFAKKTLESYLKSSSCLVCRERLEDEVAICSKCLQHADTSMLTLRAKLQKAERRAVSLERVCRSCAGLAWGEAVKCDSHDCPVFYTRARNMAELRSTAAVTQPMMGLLEELEGHNLGW